MKAPVSNIQPARKPSIALNRPARIAGRANTKPLPLQRVLPVFVPYRESYNDSLEHCFILDTYLNKLRKSDKKLMLITAHIQSNGHIKLIFSCGSYW